MCTYKHTHAHTHTQAYNLIMMDYIGLISILLIVYFRACVFKNMAATAYIKSTPLPSSILVWVNLALYKPSAFLNKVEFSTWGENGRLTF